MNALKEESLPGCLMLPDGNFTDSRGALEGSLRILRTGLTRLGALTGHQ